ncbi:MAG: [protein-PII] uridylyltransferase [Pseudomonadota bacterium]
MSAIFSEAADVCWSGFLSGIDAGKARDAAAKGDPSLGASLKTVLAETLRADLAGGAPAQIAAERRAAAVDFALERLSMSMSSVHEPLAIVGVGGYGRGLLAPYSDVDLLFLSRREMDDGVRESIASILYPLWDAGLIVGHAGHSVRGAVSAAKSDITTCTSYLDARFISGDEDIYRIFSDDYDVYRRRSGGRFTRAKLAELKARRQSAQSVAHDLEPDLKEGRGGLRDLDALGWIYRYLTGADAWRGDGLVDVIGAEEVRRLRRARLHLWAVRTHLHDLSARADDQVTFDLQPELAERLGYADRRRASGAERLMKHLRLNAITVTRLTRIALARLEERTAALSHWRPRATPKALTADEAPGRPNVRLRTGRLDFTSATAARNAPIDLFRIFRAKSKRPDLELHPDALELIAAETRRLPQEVRGDRGIRDVFLATLEAARRPLPVLRSMSECGLLGRYLPTLGRVTGQVEYGLYRRYSIEETIIRSLDAYARLRFRDLGEAHPIAAGILRRKARRRAVLVTILLQETSWAVSDRAPETVERSARRIARRFLEDERAVADVAWCAARPDRLIEVAERRNISEAETILDFAADVGTVARLETLLALTVCRHLVVSEDRWNPWTRRQVGALYFGARAALAGGGPALAAFQREEEAALSAALGDAPGMGRERNPEALAARFAREGALRLPSQLIIRGVAAAAAAQDAPDGISVDVANADAGIEAVIAAPDRPGLLGDLAGAAASAGANVRLLHAMLMDGRALDFFVFAPVDDATGLREAEFLTGLRNALLIAAAGTAGKGLKAPPPRIGDRRALFQVRPDVRIDADALDDQTLIEAEGRDRPGLLRDVAHALTEEGAAIRSAHIATYGAKACDAFYVTPVGGASFTSDALAAIERRLLATLKGAP